MIIHIFNYFKSVANTSILKLITNSETKVCEQGAYVFAKLPTPLHGQNNRICMVISITTKLAT
jgi:hypothetical protein